MKKSKLPGDFFVIEEIETGRLNGCYFDKSMAFRLADKFAKAIPECTYRIHKNTKFDGRDINNLQLTPEQSRLFRERYRPMSDDEIVKFDYDGTPLEVYKPRAEQEEY